MIADTLRGSERLRYCEHNKIPKIIVRSKYQNDAIRLQDRSKLKKLGARENPICPECCERKCRCLWSKWDQKLAETLEIEQNATKSKHTLQQQNSVVKSWNFRYTILDKFRDNRNGRVKGSTRYIPHKHSVVWLLRPVKTMYASQTNLLDDIKLENKDMPTVSREPPTTVSQITLTPMRNMSARSRESCLRKCNKRELSKTIAKDTKEYFNIRRKRLFEVINAEDQQKKKQIQEELGKRYNELDELSKAMNQDDDLSTLDLLQDTKLRLVSGADITVDDDKDESKVESSTFVSNTAKSTCRTQSIERSKNELKKIQEGLNELNPAKSKELSASRIELDSSSEGKGVKEPIATTRRLQKPTTAKKPNRSLRKSLEKLRKPKPQTLNKKRKKTQGSKVKIVRKHRQQKKIVAKKSIPLKDPILSKEIISLLNDTSISQQILSSTSLVLEESQLNYGAVKIEETSDDAIMEKCPKVTKTQEAQEQESKSKSESETNAPKILFDPSELSVAVNQIYLVEPNDIPPHNDVEDENHSPPPVITVANGAFSICFHTPINKNTLCKSVGF